MYLRGYITNGLSCTRKLGKASSITEQRMELEGEERDRQHSTASRARAQPSKLHLKTVREEDV